MEIVDFGHFKLTSTTGIQFFANEDGQDWYDLRRGLTTWDEQGNFLTAIYGAWAMVDPVTLKVTNVEQDPSRMVPNDKIVLGIDADAGDIAEGMLYQGGGLVAAPPEPLIFNPITRRQLRLTLVRNGISLAAVETAISTMPDGLEKEEAQIEWADATEFERTHPTLMLIAAALDLAEQQVDAMWRQAEIA
ncbi:hypothetical protein L905_21555 [Agrobacterium sp. TS43]|uniref:hypothetical protein n=1 Tax=Agrobacterium TaxID=357 RepID=UPI00036C7A50|nr:MULTISPECIES: hypothetical protein [Agrobacterium]EPR19761.1 hypothetical protein L902_10620 [Agrobacterium radiobacter DSM 30147]KVK45075.1 hypothetical protein L904_26280 [Agrobacterium sp. LY4]KVK45125.1 hypothetical protein L903_26250 [Agrobacterium sp. JL28]KVK58481.1 hypothetical protein L906_26165 [Agrobacterium sp. TS45]KVK61293.1 hypothetical protein L905_21555 [Agrobacterium sp. TS43]